VLSIIWLAIGLIFIYFSITFRRYNKTPQGSSIVREGQQMLSEAKSKLEKTNAVNPLFEDFDRYLESTGLKLMARTRIASIGFLLAGFASLISAYIA
jgi:uncharacterized membrane protein